MGMNYFTMTQRKSKQPPPPRKQSRPVDAAFDLWLQRGLHQLYDDVTREPIPDELLKLIQEDRKK
jgi:Anti-sigma factor NepR